MGPRANKATAQSGGKKAQNQPLSLDGGKGSKQNVPAKEVIGKPNTKAKGAALPDDLFGNKQAFSKDAGVPTMEGLKCAIIFPRLRHDDDAPSHLSQITLCRDRVFNDRQGQRCSERELAHGQRDVRERAGKGLFASSCAVAMHGRTTSAVHRDGSTWP